MGRWVVRCWWCAGGAAGREKNKGPGRKRGLQHPPRIQTTIFVGRKKQNHIGKKKSNNKPPPRGSTAKGHHQGAPPPRGTTNNNNNNNNYPFLNPFYKELLIPLLGCCACLGCCGCLDGLCELAVWLGIIKGSPNCKPDLLGSTTSQCGFSTRPRSSWSPGPGQKLPPGANRPRSNRSTQTAQTAKGRNDKNNSKPPRGRMIRTNPTAETALRKSPQQQKPPAANHQGA